MRHVIRSLGLSLGLFAAALSAHAASLSVKVVDKNGDPVANAVVTLEHASLPAGAAPPRQRAVIEQEKMRFVPELTVVGVGSTVSLVNKDPWDHHVRSQPAGLASLSGGARGFEVRLAGRRDGLPPTAQDQRLDVAGAYELSCHIHGSMRGLVVVTDAPYFAKTDASGLVRFDGLPDGAAAVKVWHAEQLTAPPADLFQLTGQVERVARLTVVPRKRRL